MSIDEFYGLSLPQIEARISVWNDRERREDVRFGQILTLYANAHRKKGATVPTPGEWFGHNPPRREMTEDEWVAHHMKWASN